MMRARHKNCLAGDCVVALSTLLAILLAPAISTAETVTSAATAVVAADNAFTQTGIASWYGGSFHGRRTASGEIFDTHQLTAAHPTLPMGSVVEITNLENGRSAVARINDRGPYIRPRIVDCSLAVARTLGFAADGLANVRVRLLHSLRPHKVRRKQGDPAVIEDTAPMMAAAADAIAASAAAPADPKFCVQLGSFRDPSNAEVLVRRASILPLPVFVHAVRTLQQVLVGPFSDVDAAAAARRDLRMAGLAGFVRSYETVNDLAPETAIAASATESAPAAATSAVP